MSLQDVAKLHKFLQPFGEEISSNVMWLREFVWNLYPQANELIYDNYNAVSIGWSPTDKVGQVFCTIAIFRTNKNIHFGFYWGNEIKDPEKKLIGEGKQYRYMPVKNIKDFPVTYFKKLLEDAYANSLSKVKDAKQIIHGQTIIKSISPVKRDKKIIRKK